MGAIDKCSIPFPLLSGGSYYVHVPMEGLPFLLQISAPSVAPGLFCCCKTSSSFTINRLFKSADIEGGLVFTYKESMLYVKRSGVYFNIIPLHSGYIFKQGTGDIPNDAIELTIQWIVDNMLLGGLLPSGTMNIYKGKFELKTRESTDLQIYDPSILILFSPLNHNPSISIIPAQWNDTISALFEGIINLNSNIEGRICLLKKGNTVTIINNSQASKFSYLRISVDVV